MFKLFPENQPTMSNEFIHAIASHYDIKVIEYNLTSSGIENSTVIIQSSSTKYVLRIYRQDKKTTADIETEINFMKHLKNHGLPIPNVIRSLNGSFVTETHHGGKVWHSIMMEFVEGIQHHHYTKKLIHDLSRVQGQIHILGEDFASDQQKIITNVLQETLFYPLLANKKFENSQIRELLERIKNYRVPLSKSLPRGYSHFDFDPDNILFDDKENILAVLDFDDTAYLPLVVCLGYTLWDLFVAREDMRMVLQYIEGYESVRTLSKEEKQLLPQIIMFRHYVVSSVELLGARRDAASESDMLKQEKLIRKISIA